MKNVMIMICGLLGMAVGTYLTIIEHPNSILWIGFGLALGIYGYIKNEFSNENEADPIECRFADDVKVYKTSEVFEEIEKNT